MRYLSPVLQLLVIIYPVSFGEASVWHTTALSSDGTYKAIVEWDDVLCTLIQINAKFYEVKTCYNSTCETENVSGNRLTICSIPQSTKVTVSISTLNCLWVQKFVATHEVNTEALDLNLVSLLTYNKVKDQLQWHCAVKPGKSQWVSVRDTRTGEETYFTRRPNSTGIATSEGTVLYTVDNLKDRLLPCCGYTATVTPFIRLGNYTIMANELTTKFTTECRPKNVLIGN